jgi:putative aminopeptidase FrvX
MDVDDDVRECGLDVGDDVFEDDNIAALSFLVSVMLRDRACCTASCLACCCPENDRL